MGVYGIDVSHWQGDIDWSAVYRAGKRFALIKASEGAGWADNKFEVNRNGAEAAGLAVGAYHYYRPRWGAKRQAEWFKKQVGELDEGDLIPWLDVEDFRPDVNTGPVSPHEYVEDMTETLKEMDEAFGLTVGIYTGLWFWNQLPITWSMDDRPLWVAYWWKDKKPDNPKLPKGWTEWAVHQYTSSGRVAGIDGDVDLDWVPGTLDEIMVKGNGGGGDKDIAGHLRVIRESVDAIEGLTKG